MNKESWIQLTNKLYSITLLFPKKEPLRYKMREIASDILAKLPENSSLAISRQCEVLDSFFEVAKKQTWVKEEELSHLQNEYSKLSKAIMEPAGQPNPAVQPEAAPQTDAPGASEAADTAASSDKPVNGRQKIILDFLRENGRARVGELTHILADVTKRTLRRDFRDLFRQGLVERIGERNETYYRLK